MSIESHVPTVAGGRWVRYYIAVFVLFSISYICKSYLHLSLNQCITFIHFAFECWGRTWAYKLLT